MHLFVPLTVSETSKKRFICAFMLLNYIFPRRFAYFALLFLSLACFSRIFCYLPGFDCNIRGSSATFTLKRINIAQLQWNNGSKEYNKNNNNNGSSSSSGRRQRIEWHKWKNRTIVCIVVIVVCCYCMRAYASELKSRIQTIDWRKFKKCDVIWLTRRDEVRPCKQLVSNTETK